MNFQLPPKEQIGYLDPSIAGEGMKVIMSSGDEVAWTPPPVKPVVPDWSQIKSIRKYFGRTGYVVFPTWLYHPKEAPRLVKDAAEAKELGVSFRQTTADERSRFGLSHVWDWENDSQWRTQPYKVQKFDPSKPEQGKNFIPPGAQQQHLQQQNELIAALIPTVTAAVAQALKGSGGPAAPANVSDKDWNDFLQFKAWQETQRVIDVATDEIEAESRPNALSADDERKLWEEEAEKKGIKVDRRWNIERLRTEVQKAG